MWNDLNLVKPLQDICEYGGRKDQIFIDSLPKFVDLLTKSAEILTEDHPIWEEVKIFKNLQTKYKRILHCDKCLQYLQRVSSCIRKMVLLHLSTVYLDLADKIIFEVQNKNNKTYFLPSRQQLEYVLIRTQSAAKLICESLHYSREAFCYLIQRLKVGHLIIHLMIATSVTARLNIVFKGLLVQIFSVYRKIYAWREKFREGGWEWPKPLELPDDLESWINLEDSEYLKPRHLPKEELDFLTTIFDKNSPSENINLDEEQSYSFEPVTEECMVVDNVNEDNGVLIKRSEIEIIEPMQCNSAEVIDVDQSTSSDEQIENVAKPEKLLKAQKALLKKIKSAKDIEELESIWENLDLSKQSLPEAVTPKKIRLIDKMFLKTKKTIVDLENSGIPKEDKKHQIDLVMKISRLKFSKNLGMLLTKGKVVKQSEIVIKPVKTFKQLKELYGVIHTELKSAKKPEKCVKLKRLYKSMKADMNLLEESGLKEDAKKLIFTTSKLFINDFL